MFQLVSRILLTAFVFSFIFPALGGGLHVHGHFWPQCVGGAAIFALIADLVFEAFALAEATFFVATLGLGLLLLIPVNAVLYWILPAIQLRVFAHFFPSYLTIDSWGYALLGGFILLCVNMATLRPRHMTQD